uniref:Uncharacterized protein n=1 Tax=Oryza sativa subsp. japonica TaxID=39947 RepID=Q69PS1_ORYSJ|nr:hypothetical protein [Oryza sativa Japonica Group]BAD33519.1 hypothetical protein [Oryza sativa Japonica Group]
MSPAKSGGFPTMFSPPVPYKSLPRTSSPISLTRRALPCLLPPPRRARQAPPPPPLSGRASPLLQPPLRRTIAAASIAAARATSAAVRLPCAVAIPLSPHVAAYYCFHPPLAAATPTAVSLRRRRRPQEVEGRLVHPPDLPSAGYCRRPPSSLPSPAKLHR